MLTKFFSLPAVAIQAVGVTNAAQAVATIAADGELRFRLHHLQTDAFSMLSPELWAEWKTTEPNRPLGIVLSNRYCRYLSVPWDDSLLDDVAGTAYLRRAFVDTYGDVAAEWDVCCPDAMYGEICVACAIDPGILAALRESCALHGAELSFVRPYFAAAFNCFRVQMSVATGLLAVVEEDFLTVGRWVDGRVIGIDVVPLPAAWPEVLAACVARNRLLEESLGDVFVLCPPAWVGDAKEILAAGWKLLAWPDGVAACVAEAPEFSLPVCAL